MLTGLKLIDRSLNRDRFRYNWRRAQVLTNPSYVSSRTEEEKDAEKKKAEKEKS